MVRQKRQNKTLLILSNKIFIGGVATLLLMGGSFTVYMNNSKVVPAPVKDTNDKIVDSLLGKDLAKKIDEKRDAEGAASIRTFFNTNKEENLAKHCDKKEEKAQAQQKCFKIYKNEEFGYSFEYPEVLKVTLNGNVSSFFTDDNSDSGFSVYSYKDISMSPEEWFSVESNKFDTKYELKSKKKIKNYEIVEYKQIGGLEETHFILKKDDQLLDLLFLGLNDEGINSIVATIKFN